MHVKAYFSDLKYEILTMERRLSRCLSNYKVKLLLSLFVCLTSSAFAATTGQMSSTPFQDMIGVLYTVCFGMAFVGGLISVGLWMSGNYKYFKMFAGGAIALVLIPLILSKLYEKGKANIQAIQFEF